MFQNVMKIISIIFTSKCLLPNFLDWRKNMQIQNAQKEISSFTKNIERILLGMKVISDLVKDSVLPKISTAIPTISKI